MEKEKLSVGKPKQIQPATGEPSQLMQESWPTGRGFEAATVDRCTLCSATAIIETTYHEFHWGRSLCGRCSAIAELMSVSQRLPRVIRPHMTTAMAALAAAWRQVLRVCSDMNRRISVQYDVEETWDAETVRYPSPP